MSNNARGAVPNSMDKIISSVPLVIPETIEIQTEDKEIFEVSGKFINECLTLKHAIACNNGISTPGPYEIVCTGPDFVNAIKLFDFYNVDEPYVPTTCEDRDQVLTRDHPAFKYLEGLSHDNVMGITRVADMMQCQRIMDVCLIYILLLSEGKSTKELRQLFMFDDDYTSEQEEALRKHHEADPCPST